jgi:Ca2+-transporting ATPase
MGVAGTDVTKEAADMVVTDDNFASIAAAVEEGRGIFDNIRKTIYFLLSCNVSEVLVMLFATLIGLPLPLLPIQVLWMKLVTDGFPALALAVDPKSPDLNEAAAPPTGGSVVGRRHTPGHRGARGYVECDRVGGHRLLPVRSPSRG